MKINQELIKRLKRGEIAIDNSGNPNVKLLRAVLKEAFPTLFTSIEGLSKWYYKSNYGNYWTNCSNSINLPTIPLNDFLEKEQFPKDDFGVIVENNNGKEIIDYLVSKGFRDIFDKNPRDAKNNGIYSIFKGIKDIYYAAPGFSSLNKRYTLQQLKNLENNMENKEITHYKILKDVWGLNGQRWRVGEILHTTNSESLPYFKETGLINNTNYFEPVYKSKEVVITVNNTVINIKGDRMVAEGKEFSIEWLRTIRELFNTRTSKESSWSTEVESVKIGCKTGWNKKHLDEIITAYNELQKQK